MKRSFTKYFIFFALLIILLLLRKGLTCQQFYILSPKTKIAYLISHVMVTVTLTLSSPRSITVASLGAEESFAIPLYIGG